MRWPFRLFHIAMVGGLWGAACGDPCDDDGPNRRCNAASDVGADASATGSGTTTATATLGTTATTTSTSTSATTTSTSTSTTSTSTSTSTTGTTTTTSTTSVTDTMGGSTTMGSTCVQHACDGQVYACGNCVDDDMDGAIDLADVECVTPCDDREDVFADGLGGGGGCRVSCAFNAEQNAQHDVCRWDLRCDPESPGAPTCEYNQNFGGCPNSQADACLNECQTPPGCDCFGCCTVSDGDVERDVLVTAACDLANFDQCPTCTKVPECNVPCAMDSCGCFGDAGQPAMEPCNCPGGGSSCDADSECAGGEFCWLGCCYPGLG